MDNKTYIPNPAKHKPTTYLFDASEWRLGRLATRVADVLTGKNRPDYTPNFELGDKAVVINARKVKVSGRKKDEKKYYRVTGYIGNLKTQTLKEMMNENPRKVIQQAVAGMIKNNRLKKDRLKKLSIQPEDKHGLKKGQYKVIKNDG